MGAVPYVSIVREEEASLGVSGLTLSLADVATMGLEHQWAL
jgi:hypothetical protein